MSIFGIATEAVVAQEKKIRTKEKRSFNDFEHALDALLTDMKAKDEKISIHGVDKTSMNVLNKVHESLAKCHIQQELERDPLDIKLTEIDINLSKLITIGETLYQNIKVEEERHEYQRLKIDNEMGIELDATIKDMGAETLAEFDNIWAKWTELGHVEDHYEVDPKLKNLKVEVGHLMEKKNKVIANCKIEYDRMRQIFNENLDQDELDMILLIRRIEAASDLISEVYTQQLDEFENSMTKKAQDLSEKCVNRMQDEWQRMLDKDANLTDIVMQKHQAYIDKLKVISREEKEFTRSVNMRLEDEFLTLQRDIIQRKKAMLISAEKHDYNLQILEQRNYEQVTISNLQKRSVSRLLQQYQELKKKSKKLEVELDQREKKLADEVEKLKKSIPEWQGKLTEVRVRNKMKFDKVWNLNFNEIVDLTNKIMQTDKLLCEIVLRKDWQPPNIDFYNINSPSINPSSKRQKSRAFPKLLRSSGDSGNPSFTPKENKSQANDNDINEENRIFRQVMRNILKQISDRGGIFLENNIIKILSSKGEKDKNLVRLDHILKVLDIDNESLLQNLTEYFLPYTWCPNCSAGLSDETLAKLVRMPHDRVGETYSMSSESSRSCTDHHLVTENAFVLSVINKFASQVLSTRIKKVKKTRTESFFVESVNLIAFDDQTIKDFFMKFLEYVQNEKLKSWKVMEHAFNHYLDILQKREQLFEENSLLKKQNEELSYFLQHIVQI